MPQGFCGIHFQNCAFLNLYTVIVTHTHTRVLVTNVLYKSCQVLHWHGAEFNLRLMKFINFV